MSQFTDSEIDALKRVQRALSTAGDFFVIAGGWAARLLRSHPLASEVPFGPIFTNDLDVAGSDKPPHAGNDVFAALEKEGFDPEYRGDDRPPITSYLLGNLELEFIAPDLPRRERSRMVDLLGVTAQRAKDVELLLVEPSKLTFPDMGVELQVAGPASFMLQRLLIIPVRRELAKRGKDTLYLHDALVVFSKGGRVREEVREQATRVIATMTKDQRKRSEKNRTALENPAHPTIKEAAKQAEATGRPGPNSPEAIALVIRLGLAELWPR